MGDAERQSRLRMEGRLGETLSQIREVRPQDKFEIEDPFLFRDGGRRLELRPPEETSPGESEIGEPQKKGPGPDGKKVEHPEGMVPLPFKISRDHDVGGGSDQGGRSP